MINIKLPFLNAFSILLLIIMLSSCRSAYNEVSYFNNINELANQTDTTLSIEKIRFQTDDVITIVVSADNQAAAAPFNLMPYSVAKNGTEELTSTRNIQTYLVDEDGYIRFPQLGKIKIGGMTRNEAVKMLELKLENYLKNPIVNINFINYKYSVMGEVANPGVYPINGDRISILDAIGSAGDLTIQAQRRNVLLIREVKGIKEVHQFDLTDANIINSPYFYIQQNDVIYIEPNNAKKRNSKYSPMDAFNVSIISTIVGGISVVTSILVALIK
ncbi:MAG: polysaccharide biosynthesis/export family protein [Bacteroidales bacterium]|nr:polysaccharide biosynthesis/export family protein [Bacteroidales bacterium]